MTSTSYTAASLPASIDRHRPHRDRRRGALPQAARGPFARKVEVRDDVDRSTVVFGVATCEVQATDGLLTLVVDGTDLEAVARAQDVAGGHLERFGRRDGLTLTWDVRD